MFQVQCLKATTDTATEFYSKYSIGPFLKGQSTTVGNALRRVLLSNLQGLAISGVRITGIDHEFSTIPNVKEDVVDILLNLKQIILKGNISKPILARLNVKEAGIIVAGDIDLPSSVTLIDPRQYIATLNSKGNLEMEFLIAAGQNYFASGKLDYTIPESFLAVDAVFMPVLKVNYKINNVYLGYSKTTESLILEITTNGSVSPEKALSEAAQKLMTWFSFLTSEQHLAPQKEVEVEPIAQNDVILIEELQLPVRAYNCLKRAGINSVDDLVNYSQEEIREIKNFGKKSAQEVFQALKDKFDIVLPSLNS